MSDDLLFEIRNPAVDDEVLRQEVDRRAAARDLSLPNYPTFGRLSAAAQVLNEGQLGYHLQEATARYGAADLQMVLASSPATQLPLVGSLWQGLRRHLHELVLFYVHKLAGHTAAVDQHLVGALSELARRSALQEEELATLRARVAELEGVLEAADDAEPEEST